MAMDIMKPLLIDGIIVTNDGQVQTEKLEILVRIENRFMV